MYNKINVLKVKKILMILAPSEFRDLEYIVPREFFESVNFEVTTTSSEMLSTWRFGYEVYHDWLIWDYKNDDFDAIVFVWWAGSLVFWENEELKELTKKFINSNKIVASICASPRNLLKWWVVEWKKITGHNWDNNFENLAKQSWAIPEQKAVVVDENLITWYWPEAVEEFALAIIDKLK